MDTSFLLCRLFALFQKNKMGIITAAAAVTAVGLGSAVVVPLAVAGLGFGAAGIAAGSTAAWMMSLGGG